MGSSATATLAWGIDFGDPENTMEGFDWDEAGVDSYDFEHNVMPGLLGFTEEPPERPGGLEGDALREWHAEHREPYKQRLDAAVPFEFVHYGYELGGTALVLKRSLTTAEWSCEPVDAARHAPPTADELAALGVILGHLGHEGGAPKLLLMASYG